MSSGVSVGNTMQSFQNKMPSRIVKPGCCSGWVSMTNFHVNIAREVRSSLGNLSIKVSVSEEIAIQDARDRASAAALCLPGLCSMT